MFPRAKRTLGVLIGFVAIEEDATGAVRDRGRRTALQRTAHRLARESEPEPLFGGLIAEAVALLDADDG